MSGYLAGFTVYTLAMTGLIFLAFIVAKKAMNYRSISGQKEQFLSIENCLDLGARKSIYVLRAGEEKFLVASDAEKTTFLTKLQDEVTKNDKNVDTSNVSYMTDLPDISAITRSKEVEKPFMKELLKKLNA